VFYISTQFFFFSSSHFTFAQITWISIDCVYHTPNPTCSSCCCCCSCVVNDNPQYTTYHQIWEKHTLLTRKGTVIIIYISTYFMGMLYFSHIKICEKKTTSSRKNVCREIQLVILFFWFSCMFPTNSFVWYLAEYTPICLLWLCRLFSCMYFLSFINFSTSRLEYLTKKKHKMLYWKQHCGVAYEWIFRFRLFFTPKKKSVWRQTHKQCGIFIHKNNNVDIRVKSS
jgi:hypothetical protein